MTDEADGMGPERSTLDRLRDLYRRKPVLAWGGTAVVVGVVIAVIVILAVGGSSEPANIAIKCSVSDSDGSTALSIEGRVTQKEADEGCDALAAKLSGTNSYWRVGLPEPPPSYPEIVCGLNAPKGEQGTAIVEVNPESIGSPATTICGTLAHEGWTQFTQGGVMGPWQAEAQEATEFEEEAERAEREVVEGEEAEREAEAEAVYRCEERAQVEEEAEIEAIEKETEERVEAEPNEFKQYEIEEEGYEREEEAYERDFEANELCEETGGEVEGGIDYR